MPASSFPSTPRPHHNHKKRMLSTHLLVPLLPRHRRQRPLLTNVFTLLLLIHFLSYHQHRLLFLKTYQ